MRAKQWLAFRLGLFLALAAARGADVGLYVPNEQGGKVVGEAALKNSLEAAGTSVAELARLSLENLLRYRLVIIPNTRALAQNEDPRWRDNLRAYVTECGGALIFCHDAIGAKRSPFGLAPLFPEIAVPGSVERGAVAEARVAAPDIPDFEFLAGYESGQTVSHMYDDHFMFTPSDGIVILTDIESDQAVVAAGIVGKGRVVFNGLFGGKSSGLAAQLEGIDQDVLLGAVRWCLAGKRPDPVSADQVKVREWRPDLAGLTKSAQKIAVLGGTDYDIRHRARTKITSAGLAHDFIPFHFLNMRGLSPDDYRLVVIFPPRVWEEDNVPATAFAAIKAYLDGGGQAIVFLPGGIGGKTTELFLRPIGSKPLAARRDNPEELCAVNWSDSQGQFLQIKEPPENWFSAISSPSAPGAETIGYWVNSAGDRKAPAIVKTDFGYIVNVNKYGDHRLFTANAAAELLPEAGADIFGNLLKTFMLVEREVDAGELSQVGRVLRAQAGEARRAAEAAAQKGDFIAANRQILQAEAALVRAYAVSMASVAGEERIAWTWARDLPDPEKICARLAQAGFTGVAVTHLEGHYPSKLYARHDAADRTDWMQKWIDAAHQHGLKIGPGFSTFNIHEGAEIYDRALSEDWRVVPAGMYGKPVRPFRKLPRLDVCRARPEMADYAIAKSREVIEQYKVDYIFYDYIRWADACYCAYCRMKFEGDTGLKIEKWPEDVMGKYQGEYNDWRARPVTRVVRAVSENIARINPAIRFGVATFRGRRESWSKGQYWWEWGNYVDFVMPMIYGPDNRRMEELFVEINGLLPAGGKARLMACLAPPGEKGGADLVRLQQINLQRQYAPAGVMYFWYHGLSDAYLELLGVGPFRAR